MPQNDSSSVESQVIQAIDRLHPHLSRLWSERKRFVIANVVVMILALLYLFFVAKLRFESTVVILPEYGNKFQLSGLGDLASLAGVNIGETAPTEIYQNIVLSETVLEPVILSKYKTEQYPDSVNLLDYFEIKGDKDLPSDLRERKRFVKFLEDKKDQVFDTDLQRLTKILNIGITMPESKLSMDVANRLVESLDRYIRTKRKSYATNQRIYLDKRLAQVQDTLRIAENRLLEFKEKNRSIDQSPELSLQQARLSREVDVLNAAFLNLTTMLETAKIDEIRDTPVINLRENARDPVLKTGPKRLRALILVMFFSALVTAVYYSNLPTVAKYRRIIKERLRFTAEGGSSLQ